MCLFGYSDLWLYYCYYQLLHHTFNCTVMWSCAVSVCCRMIIIIACLEAQVLSHEDGQDSG